MLILEKLHKNLILEMSSSGIQIPGGIINFIKDNLLEKFNQGKDFDEILATNFPFFLHNRIGTYNRQVRNEEFDENGKYFEKGDLVLLESLDILGIDIFFL